MLPVLALKYIYYLLLILCIYFRMQNITGDITTHIYAEFATIARATGIGFLIMGFTGFFVKLIHIPINNIIVGGV